MCGKVKGTCSSEKKDSKANPLGLTNVGGIFVVLFGKNIYNEKGEKQTRVDLS